MFKPKLALGKFLKRKEERGIKDQKAVEGIKDDKAKIRPKFSLLNLFRKKKGEERKGIEYLKEEIRKQEKKLAIAQDRRKKLSFYLEKAGLGLDPRWLSKNIFNLCVFINLVISAFLIYHFSVTFGITWTTILLSIVTIWVLAFVLMLFLLWILFYVIVDLKIFKRRVDIEDVLPDYLQLTASNIKSGMTIDRALWYAVRPRFGVLAKEIETVAKDTMKGEDLKEALQKFADKYESVLLKRSISLLIEGLDAGGEMGDLLNKIALNIQENRIMRREMAANVTTYVIFISFASVAAAPVLFALSGILIKVVSSLGGALGGATSASTAVGLGISFSSAGIQYSDFRIFAVVSLLITSFFSAVIIATIKKGSAKNGFKYIPIFAVISVSLFLIADQVLGKLSTIFF
ncbi:type II secretion system F family protein [Candidatus Woesearchaeota archaeon]|nr:type II secretion system F family protein [Candidatus Woesearchaeota archaeon]